MHFGARRKRTRDEGNHNLSVLVSFEGLRQHKVDALDHPEEQPRLENSPGERGDRT